MEPDDRLGRDALGLALEVEDDPVAERRQRDGPDVVDRDVEPAVEQGVDLAGGDEGLGAARRAAVAHVVADEAGRARLVGVGRGQDAHGVGGHVRGDRDGPGEALHLDDLGRGADLAGRDGSVPVVRSMIAIRSSSDGNGTMTLNRNRSSCASGRG